MEIKSFKKNHPKNALGYALAVQANGSTSEVFKQYVIQSVNDARHDSAALDLVTAKSESYRLTPRGREAVRTILYHHDGILSALKAIQEQSGSAARFIDELPVMGVVARQALLSYRPTTILIGALDELAERGHTQPSLAQVAKVIARDKPDFALNFFISPEDRDEVCSNSGESIDLEIFEDGSIFSTHTTFQYKAMLYHAGILTTRGSDTKSKLDPNSVVWALEDTMPR